MNAQELIFWAQAALYGWAVTKGLILALFVVTLLRVNFWLSRKGRQDD